MIAKYFHMMFHQIVALIVQTGEASALPLSDVIGCCCRRRHSCCCCCCCCRASPADVRLFGSMTVKDLNTEIIKMSPRMCEALGGFEKENKKRVTVLKALDRRRAQAVAAAMDGA